MQADGLFIFKSLNGRAFGFRDNQRQLIHNAPNIWYPKAFILFWYQWLLRSIKFREEKCLLSYTFALIVYTYSLIRCGLLVSARCFQIDRLLVNKVRLIRSLWAYRICRLKCHERDLNHFKFFLFWLALTKAHFKPLTCHMISKAAFLDLESISKTIQRLKFLLVLLQQWVVALSQEKCSLNLKSFLLWPVFSFLWPTWFNWSQLTP